MLEPTYCKKSSFIDEKQALLFIEKKNKTSIRDIVPKRAYLCDKCLKWHITSLENIDVFEENKELKKQIKELTYNNLVLETRLKKIMSHLENLKKQNNNLVNFKKQNKDLIFLIKYLTLPTSEHE